MPRCNQQFVSHAAALCAVAAACYFACMPCARAASHSYYFANHGQRGAPCSMQSPGADMSDAQAKVGAAGPNDTVYLYFKRGDTWRFDTAAVVKKVVFGLAVSNDDPIVHIDAYGSGNKPVFDGMITDWTAVPSHNAKTGPLRWNRILQLGRPNCSVKNLEIRNTYAIGIQLHSDHDGAVVSHCDIHHFGGSSIRTKWGYDAQDVTIEHCRIHDGQLLFQYGKVHAGCWAGGITLKSETVGPPPSGNLVRYNLVYDIMGEGINCANAIVEHNVVGDTFSIGICTVPHNWDFGVNIVRHNLVTMSDWKTSIYDGFKRGSGPHGIRVFDEAIGEGNNLGCDIQYYGNVIVNRSVGIWVFNHPTAGPGDRFGPVKIFNNTIIDSHAANFRVGNLDQFTDVKIYNNASLFLDRPGGRHVQVFSKIPFHAGWSIENNAFWSAGAETVVDEAWRKGAITADPRLAGEPAVDWDGQRGAGYCFGITLANTYPLAGSSLIDSGRALAGYDTMFMTVGSDFSGLPETANVILADQGKSGTGWDIGALIYTVPAAR